MGATARRIDAAYLNALRLGPQRIGGHGVPVAIATRLAAAGLVVMDGEKEVRHAGE